MPNAREIEQKPVLDLESLRAKAGLQFIRSVPLKLSQARKYALSLPETSEEPHFDYSSFRVRGKIFATVPPSGDFLHIFVDDDQRAPLIAAQPEIYEALHWGAKVVGVKVTLSTANAATVNRLLRQSWLRKAPKRVAALLNP